MTTTKYAFGPRGYWIRSHFVSPEGILKEPPPRPCKIVSEGEETVEIQIDESGIRFTIPKGQFKRRD